MALAEADPELYGIIRDEKKRQRYVVRVIGVVGGWQKDGNGRRGEIFGIGISYSKSGETWRRAGARTYRRPLVTGYVCGRYRAQRVE